MGTKAIEVKDLFVSYNGKVAIEEVHFSFESGNLIGILGPNGAGKSTMIQAILNLITKDSGRVSFNGKQLKDVQKEIAYVPQRSKIDWDFPIIVKDTVLLGTYPKLGLFKRPNEQHKKWALECLKKVGMEDYADEQIGNLSGGQQQRVFVARALAQKANLFFLDEPFTGIDINSEEVIINILKTLRDEGKTVFVVHHDLSKVEDYFDQLILINKQIIDFGPVEKVFNPKKIKETYNRDLLFATSEE